MAENNFRADRLEEAIHTYGLDLPDDIKWDNEKMIKALGDYFISIEPDKYSWGARYVQSLNTCMLCKHLKDFIQYMPINPMESEDYIAENKINGCRILATYSPESGFEFFTRRESSSNYLNGNIANKILFINKGLISEPKDYIGKFKYRFVLDCEIIVDGLRDELTTTNISIEDYIQSIFSSNEERAKEFQRDGHAVKLIVFDVLYFAKAEEIDNTKLPNYNYRERELTPEVVSWVEEHYSKFLSSAGFNGIGRAKKLYQYLISLKGCDKHDVRRLPFLKRREIRQKIIAFLNKYNLPFEEVDYEDTYKTAFLEEILRAGGEGCFHGRTQVNMADGSYKRIKDVKGGDLVLSYNEKLKQVEAKRVLKVFNNGLKSVNEWCSVSHGALQRDSVASKQNKFKRIICTKSHEFFIGGKYSPISELSYCFELSPLIEGDLRSALIGWVLSDGCIVKDGIITLSQKEDSPWWHDTINKFSVFSKNGHKTRISGKGSLMGYMSLLKCYTTDIVTLYKEHGKIGLIKELDLIGLACMIMGDGAKNKKRLSLHTESMNKEEFEALKEKILELTEIQVSEKIDKRVSTYGHIICFSVNDTDKLFNLIGKYIHPDMQYKFGTRRVSYQCLPSAKLGIRKVPILKKDLQKYKNFSKDSQKVRAWDLEVEDNHNYFVENVLVHNCVLKNIHAPYISDLRSSRNHRAAMKVKQSISNILNGDPNLVEDFDVFITGANPPKSDRIKDMIGSLKCSVYIKKEDGSLVEHEIANVSGLSHDWKRKLAALDVNTGRICLNPEYEGKVIAINGLALTKGNLKFQHATLKNKGELEFKAKNPSECVWEENVLKDMVITRGE